YCGEREPGCLAQLPEAEAQVEGGTLDAANAPAFAHCLLVLLHAAECERRAPARFVAAYPLARVLRTFHVDMEAHLLIELRFHAAARQERTKPHGDSF